MANLSWKALVEESEKAETGGFKPLEPGMYPFVIKEVGEVTQGKEGLPIITIKASVEEGERKNALVFHRFNVSTNGWAMKNFFFGPLAVLGIPESYFKQDPEPTIESVAAALQGKRFTGKVEHKDSGNPDKPYVNITSFHEPGPAPQAGVPGGLPSAAPAGAAWNTVENSAPPAAPSGLGGGSSLNMNTPTLNKPL